MASTVAALCQSARAHLGLQLHASSSPHSDLTVLSQPTLPLSLPHNILSPSSATPHACPPPCAGSEQEAGGW
eukprot:332206-Rhodomonas_salina.1